MDSFNSDRLKPVKWYRDLASGRQRRAAGAFLVEGIRAARQVINSAPYAVLEILSTHELPDDYQRYPIRIITEKQLHSISTTQTPQSVIAIVKSPQQIYSTALPHDTGSRILLLEDIQDPGNTGTLIRSAAAFGFSGVILSSKCADPLSPKCVQSTVGTLLSLWIRRTTHYLEMVTKLKRKGFKLVATDLCGEENMAILGKTDRLLLALGNEANGLTSSLRNVSDFLLKIPIAQQKAESLNVAACGAICMYQSNHPD